MRILQREHTKIHERQNEIPSLPIEILIADARDFFYI
jgi:hypothetical protein